MSQKPIDLVQIGSSLRSGEIESASINKLRKPENRSKTQQQQSHRPKKVSLDENSSFSSINNVNHESQPPAKNVNGRKHRFHRNSTKTTTTTPNPIEQPTTEQIRSYKSPYIILIDEEANSIDSESSSSTRTRDRGDETSFLTQAIQNSSPPKLRCINSSCFLVLLSILIGLVF